jgi:NADH-quinone oxidoreductase subunit M
MQLPILTVLIFLPLLGIVPLLFLDGKNDKVLKGYTLVLSLVEFVLSLRLWFGFNDAYGGMQFVEQHNWLPQYGISYHLGIDGFSLLLILLATLLTPICVLATWNDVQHRAIKFFLYTMFGSLLMLVAILVLYFYHGKVTGTYTFDLLKMYGLGVPFHMQFWMFLAFALAFAIKVPMFPFHTWLPDAHTEAPTVGSVILAAVLLKMGTYGFLRFNMPLFPEAAHYFVPLFCILAVIGIVYGALVSMVQPDLKRLIAFSSVSHLGFVMLGLFAFNMQGVQGGVLQMINHGLSTGALFLIVGCIYERRHTRLISEFGGISSVMPIFATIFMIVALSSIGLPGLNGFVGEFLILLGAFQVNKFYAAISATGVIFAACYMLWMFQRVMFGKCTNEKNQVLQDLDWREIGYFLPLLLFIVWIGVYPNTFLNKTQATTAQFVAQMEKAKAPKLTLSQLLKTKGEAR